MTPEEAAEEILGGRAYTRCTRCNGSGWSSKPPRAGIIGLRDYCDSCQGSGQWLRGDYVAACVIVGKDPPPKPRTTMYLKSDESWKDKLTKYGRSSRISYFDQIQLLSPDQATFKKEYMGKWDFEPEERNDTADAMKYAMESRPLQKPCRPDCPLCNPNKP